MARDVEEVSRMGDHGDGRVIAHLTRGAKLVLIVLALCIATAARQGSAQGAASFTFLSYNVRGLPMGLSFPGERFPTIGYLANQYDIILTQEMFGGEAKLAGQMRGKQAIAGVGLQGDPGKIVLKVLALPFTFFVPDFWPPFGDGLYTFVDDDMISDPAAIDVERVPYRACHGFISSGADCFSRKALLRVRIQPQPGIEIDVYNTHLDSGGDEDSQNARWSQLKQLACVIDSQGTARPIIVAGDLNIGYARPGDQEILAAFRDHLGLIDSGAGPENPRWRERDYILYRHGNGTRLRVDQFGEAKPFVQGDYALSDHPALFAQFRVEPDTSGLDQPAARPRFNCDAGDTGSD